MTQTTSNVQIAAGVLRVARHATEHIHACVHVQEQDTTGHNINRKRLTWERQAPVSRLL